MKTTIQSFETINATIKMSNMVYDPKARTMTLDLGIKGPKQRKFRTQSIKAICVKEVHDFFTLMLEDKVKVAADNEDGFVYANTGTKSTRFQRYLKREEIPFKTGILNDLIFECANTSQHFSDNPFRLAMLPDGNNVLTLVNVPSKKRTERFNGNTGEVETNYTQKYGKFADGTVVRAFIRPEKYRRLVTSTTKKVEVIQD